MISTLSKSIHRTRTLYLILALFAAVCNTHLLRGDAPSELIFSIDGVLSGEIYRLFTHPLVHVSWYHLILDSSCMALLFSAARTSLAGKLAAALCCGATSLAYAVTASPYIAVTGYCGLSGIAHGFMFLVGWLWLFPADRGLHSRSRFSRILGLLFCITSLAKSIWEVHSGQVLFDATHAGYLGTPIVHSHLGGVIGGLFAALFITTGRALFRRQLPYIQSTGYIH